MTSFSSDPDDILGWQRIDARLTSSGRLTEPDLARLAALRVRHVVNLAMPDHPWALADEEAKLARHGMAYDHIPVPFNAPGDEHFARFCAVMDSAPRPLHVHCIMNWRVSAFLYRYHRDVMAMPESQARALMERHWSPETAELEDAPVWARFIGGGRK